MNTMVMYWVNLNFKYKCTRTPQIKHVAYCWISVNDQIRKTQVKNWALLNYTQVHPIGADLDKFYRMAIPRAKEYDAVHIKSW